MRNKVLGHTRNDHGLVDYIHISVACIIGFRWTLVKYVEAKRMTFVTQYDSEGNKPNATFLWTQCD